MDVSPPGCWAQVNPREAQTALRHSFQRWVRPERLRVDNGPPGGSRGDPPTDLVCWLAGLGVEVAANPPRKPRDNGVVERSRGVGKRWREPWTCETGAAPRERSGVMDQVRRERYPGIGGRTRMEAYPGLKRSGRPYDPAQEETDWDLKKVWEPMGIHRVPRRVDGQGKVSVYNRPYSVGQADHLGRVRPAGGGLEIPG